MKKGPKSVVQQIKEAPDEEEDKILCRVFLVMASHLERYEPGTLPGVTQVLRAYADKKGWKAEGAKK